MKHIVVFGATGNVGSYFIKYAAENLDLNKYNIIPSGKRKDTKVFRKLGGG